MATYTKIGDKWRAQVRRVGHKDISKSFTTKAKAIVWATDIERGIEAGVSPQAKSTGTIGDLIDKYIVLRSSTRPVGRKSTEHYMLKTLKRTIGGATQTELTYDRLLGWAQERRDESVTPYTINCDLSKLATVFRYTAPTLLAAIDAARPKLRYLGLIGGSKPRERRPSPEELASILEWLQQHCGQQTRDFVAFAALTAMRRSECARVLWDDLDRESRLILIRDRKDPRAKIGNDQWIPLLYGSFEIVLNQNRVDERIFPVNPKAMTKAFTECRKALGLDDIVLHDMRHEGISHMFEAGFDIPHVAVVSGHKSWSHLKRYTNIKPETLHARAEHLDTQQHPGNQQTASSHPHTSEP